MAAITNPARLLNGFTFEVSPFLPCYVLGCRDEAVVGRLHQVRGRVDACPSHDPAKHGYARSFGVPAPIAVPEPPTPRPLNGGTKVPRRPIPPVIPPMPDALALPGPVGRAF
jgi:hypothetical protein